MKICLHAWHTREECDHNHWPSADQHHPEQSRNALEKCVRRRYDN